MSSCELIYSVLDVIGGDLIILILMREELPGLRGQLMLAVLVLVVSSLVNLVSPMLVGLSITGIGTCFLLPRVGMPLPEIAPADATHVSFLPLIEGFLLLLFA